MSVMIVLPSLNPDERLPALVQSLIKAGMEVLVVDDGSAAAHQSVFAAAEALDRVTVLHHDKNYGKGHALKTAFTYLRENRPDVTTAVTADGDGQHRVEDILRVAEASASFAGVVLGARDFDAPDIPARSHFGNRCTRVVMRFVCRRWFADTQTGLRGIPADLFPLMEQIEGERFEYETNMLLHLCREDVAIREVPVATVYEDNNAVSHFRPIRDSIRIYWLVLRFFISFVCSSLLCTLVDQVLFWVLCHAAFFHMPEARQILVATVLARVISAGLNFFINRRVVFRSNANLPRTMVRYFLLSGCQMLASALLVVALNALIPPLEKSIAKMIVDTCLFIASYCLQRRFVFGIKK